MKTQLSNGILGATITYLVIWGFTEFHANLSDHKISKSTRITAIILSILIGVGCALAS